MNSESIEPNTTAEPDSDHSTAVLVLEQLKYNLSSKNPYEILGIRPDCPQSEILSSYRRLAMKFHPDRKETPDPAAFAAVKKAYDTLSDSDKRLFFDTMGQPMLSEIDLTERANREAVAKLGQVCSALCSENSRIPLDALGTVNPMMIATQHLREDLNSLTTKRKGTNTEIKRFELMQRKFRRKNPVFDATIFGNQMKHTIRELRTRFYGVSESMRIVEAAIPLVSAVEYELDEQPQPSFNSFYINVT